MSEPVRKGAGYADVLAAPEHVVAEVIEGDLYYSPRPDGRHAVAASVLGADLLDAFMRGRSGPGGWILIDEPELHLGRDIVVPDIAGWRTSRMAEVPDAAYFTLRPDFVCEVLSPSTARVDRVKKLRIYAREEVEHAWLVDPVERTLEVFRRENAFWVLAGVFSGDEQIRAEPFEAVPLELGVLWAFSPR